MYMVTEKPPPWLRSPNPPSKIRNLGLWLYFTKLLLLIIQNGCQEWNIFPSPSPHHLTRVGPHVSEFQGLSLGSDSILLINKRNKSHISFSSPVKICGNFVMTVAIFLGETSRRRRPLHSEKSFYCPQVPIKKTDSCCKVALIISCTFIFVTYATVARRTRQK